MKQNKKREKLIKLDKDIRKIIFDSLTKKYNKSPVEKYEEVYANLHWKFERMFDIKQKMYANKK
jgi:hypothetical protein